MDGNTMNTKRNTQCCKLEFQLPNNNQLIKDEDDLKDFKLLQIITNPGNLSIEMFGIEVHQILSYSVHFYVPTTYIDVAIGFV